MDLREWVGLVLQSGLLSQQELRSVLATVPPDIPGEPVPLANFLVQQGHLTRFQADKVLSGVVRGLVFGPYRLLDLVGQGPSAMVYQALDTRDGQVRALKVLPPRAAEAKEGTALRFQQEMAFCKKLHHPNIARPYEIGRQEGIYYIALDFLPGKDLTGLVQESGPLSPARAARIFAQAAAGLAHAHTAGLIHRDITPNNIRVGSDDRAWVLDFGLARLVTDPVVGTAEERRSSFVGRPGYIAPEQVLDSESVTDRADVFSLGCCLYFALAAREPYPGGSRQEQVAAPLRGRPRPVQDHVADLSAGLVSLLEEMLAPEATGRPSAAEVSRRLLEGEQGRG